MNNLKLFISSLVLIVVLCLMVYQLNRITGQTEDILVKVEEVLPAPAIGPKLPVIKLRVTGGASGNRELKIDEGPPCENSANMGCVEVLKGNKEIITYTFNGSPKWKFTRMQFVPGVDAPKKDFKGPGGFKHEYSGDFYVKVDSVHVHPDSHGIIDLKGSTNGVRDFILFDSNNEEETYTYQIEACGPFGPNDSIICEMTDPKIINRG